MVLWIFGAVAICGFSLGLLCRAPALIVATLAVAMLFVALGVRAEWAPGTIVAATIAAALTLQVAYLAGLWAGSASRTRPARVRWIRMVAPPGARPNRLARGRAPTI